MIRRLRAFLGGYFWLPCPRCGRMFGGFEIGEDTVEVFRFTEDGGYAHTITKVCCRKCSL